MYVYLFYVVYTHAHAHLCSPADSTRGLATGVDMAISVTLTALVMFFLGVVY